MIPQPPPPPPPPLVTSTRASQASNKKKTSKGKRTKSIMSRKTKKQKLDTTINRTLTINMYPNRSQKGLLKRWMGLTRIAYNAVVAWNRKRCFFNVDRQKQWLKHQTFEKKCE